MPRKTKTLTAKDVIQNAQPIKEFIDNSCAIYFLISAGVITYVGQTINGMYRVWMHFDKTILNINTRMFDDFYIQPCRREELDDLETEYILRFNPKYNSSISSIKTFTSLNTLCFNSRTAMEYVKEKILADKIPHYVFQQRIYVKRELAQPIFDNMPNRESITSRRGRRVVDIKGKQFTDLQVVEFSHQDSLGHAHWVCQCACNEKITVSAYKLKAFTVKSCGRHPIINK